MNEAFTIDPKQGFRFVDRNKAKKRRSSSNTAATDTKSPKSDSIVALVVDNGAYNIKIGLSTETSSTLIPNCIMKAKSERKRLFIGNQINECRDCSGLYFLLPCERGYITKWDVQKPVWDHIFSKNLFPIEDKPVIMTQPLFNFKSVQECIDEIFFEEYEVSSMFRLNPTDMALLKFLEDNRLLADNTPCVIVDSGFSFTHIIPYINGNKYLRAIKRLNVGGKLLTNHLKDLISYRQYNVMEETFVINQVKEDTCYVAENVIEELKLAQKKSNSIVKNYVLPDFNNIRRGYIQDPNDVDQKEKEESCQILRLNNERFVVPEILFNPSDIGMKSIGIADAVVQSIFLCPKNQREQLSKNIVLIGGNCKFPGFKDRMYSELRSHLPQEWEVVVHLPNDPISYSWHGGAPLLKNPNFKSFLVTKSEYDELGPNNIQQRFNNWMADTSEPEEVVKKNEETIFYLENIKGKSIFGKQEADGYSEDLNDKSETNDAMDVSQLKNTESSDVTDQVSDLISLETETNGRQKKNLQKNNGRPPNHFNDINNDLENEILNSVDIFPFGIDSYL